MRYAGTTALITGASSGIGAEFAQRFAGRGADLVLVARREEALESLASQIRTDTGRSVRVVPFDLTEERSGHRLAALLEGQGVDTVVNCAGVAHTKPFAASSEDEIRVQLRVNLDATVGITRAFLPQLIASGCGALVNVASLTGYLSTPGMAVYSASKSFVVRFTEALAHETRESGLTVLALSPGPTSTEFYGVSGTRTSGVRFQTAAQVVGTAIAALDRRKPPVSVISGSANRWARRVAAVLPKRTALRLVEARPV
ncbi:SDR family oxidoreductase [Lentzea sp. CC55]|uniref:SDR family NAD(P)-dependent oxidoreductase n=1 Tax=Lentzea sp. CC55 TaxID=2884909 RepID=UPI001F3845A9|nr:SDR family NAD(P)-dependent oxidoreductase [Lentzea sp. CC55]MCG8921849.1 SDR family NAD(P)-dependent oxidoreductase [Lentzea sp. CC55]